MNVNNILLALDTIILIGIIFYIYSISSYVSKNFILEHISQIFKHNEANLKQEFYLFLEDVKEEYSKHQNEILKLLKEQETETERLKKVIKEEKLAFKKYFQDRIETQEKINKQIENRISNSQKHIAMLEKKLSQSKRKIERLKNENVRTE